MARNLGETTITLSVLDRLIDRQPENRVETAPSRPESVRQFKTSVRRDLEWLLNTRANLEIPPDPEDKIRKSVYGYGLPDLSLLSMANAADRNKLTSEIKRAINRFEKRLDKVQLTIVQRPDQARKDVHLRIDAVLRMDPAPEPVFFDTVIELKSGVCRLSEGPDAR